MKTAVENIMEQTNGHPRTTLEEATPHPLGERVQHEQGINGGNASVISREIGVRTADPEKLPTSVRKARAAVDRASAEQSKADTKLNAELKAWQHYANFQNEIKSARQNLSDLEWLYSGAQRDLAGFPGDFDELTNRLGHSPAQLFERVDSLLKAQVLVAELPKRIEAHRTKLTEMENQAEELRKQYE